MRPGSDRLPGVALLPGLAALALLAAACGPLSVEDFGSWRQEQHLTRDGLAAITDTITTLATAEGLTAHRLAALIRFEDEEQS